MLGDSPDQLETIQQGRHGLSDALQLAIGDVLELALQSLEELHEVLGLGLQLHKVLELTLVLLQGATLLPISEMSEDANDPPDIGHVELLEEGVEGG